jgi:hypothetical protein
MRRDQRPPWERAVPLGCAVLVIGWVAVILVLVVVLVVR